MIAKRIFDLVFSLAGLILLSPLFLLIAFTIKYDSAGPVFFRQIRVGRRGEPFRIHKFRTMATDTTADRPAADRRRRSPHNQDRPLVAQVQAG